MKSSLMRSSKTRSSERENVGLPNGNGALNDTSEAKPAADNQSVLRDSNTGGLCSLDGLEQSGSGSCIKSMVTSQWKSRKSVGGTILKSIRRKLPWNRHSSVVCGEGTSNGDVVVGTDFVDRVVGSQWSHGSARKQPRAVCLVDSPFHPPVHEMSSPEDVGDEACCSPTGRQSCGEENPRPASVNEEEVVGACNGRSTPSEESPGAAGVGHGEEQCPAAGAFGDDGSYMNFESSQSASLTAKLRELPQNGWYWGPLTRAEAEEKLVDQPDGAFLVRDSSDHHYLLSLSFRSFGKTLHTRIEHRNGIFSFYAQSPSEGHLSIVDLIEHSMNYSQSGVFCYSRARGPGAPSYPVRLTRPISRFTRVRSLQYLCRFVIRQHTSVDMIGELPLPNPIKGFVEEGYY